MLALPALYERAIGEAAKRRFAGDLNAEAALRAFWVGYIDTLVSPLTPIRSGVTNWNAPGL